MQTTAASLGALATKMGAHAAHTTPTLAARTSRMNALMEHLRGPACASMFTPYLSVCGVHELPMIVIENQADGAKSGFARMQFTQFTEDAIECIRRRDTELFMKKDAVMLADDQGALPERTINFVQKKWLIPHTGELGERVDNKTVAEALVWDLIEHYAATELLRFFTDLQTARLNRHDVSDAFLMAMNRAQEMYAAHARTQLPRRKRGEPYPPVLSAEQMGSGGSIQVVGIDPGFTNLGLCHLDLVAQQLPPHDAGRPENQTEPIFRVMSIQLVNLHLDKMARRYVNSCAVMQLISPTRVYAPDYTTSDIRTFFQRAQTIVDDHKAQKAQTDTTPTRAKSGAKRSSAGPTGKKDAKRARKDPPQSAPFPVIDLVDDD